MGKQSDYLTPVLSKLVDMICTIEELHAKLKRATWHLKLGVKENDSIEKLVKRWTEMISESEHNIRKIKIDIEGWETRFKTA